MKNLRKKSYQKIQKLDNRKTISGYVTKACLRLAVFVSALPFYLFMRPSNSFEIMAVRKNDGTFVESYHGHLAKRKLSMGTVVGLVILAAIIIAYGSVGPVGQKPTYAGPGGDPAVTIIASQNKTDEGSAAPVEFTFQVNPAFGGDKNVNFLVQGRAKNGTDYPTVSSPITIPGGQTSKALGINTTHDLDIEGDEVIQLVLQPGPGYQVGNPNKAVATIQDNDDQNWNVRYSGVQYALTGVSMLDANNVWATGTTGGQPASGKILYFNGQYWEEQEAPEGFAAVNDVSAVAADNVYAVADSESSSVIKYDGKGWLTVSTPKGIATLKGIHAKADNNIWIVGGKDGPPPFGTVIYQFNGSKWNQHLLSGDINIIRAVYALDATHVWVVGQKNNETEATIWFHDGSSWAQPTIPAGIGNLLDVHAVAANNVFAVGIGTEGNPGPKILHFDGSNWSEIPPTPNFAIISGVDGINGSNLVWIVGNTGDNRGSVALYNEGNVLGTQSMPEGTQNLNAVSMLSTTHGFAVGQKGNTLFYGANPAQAVPTASNLSASHSPNEVGKVDLIFTIFDVNYDASQVKIEYSPDNGANWFDPALDTVKGAGEPAIDNALEYQVTGISTITPNTLDVLWNTKSALNGGGSMDKKEYDKVKFRVTPKDANGTGTTVTSESFVVDDKTPALASISLKSGAEATSDRGVNVATTHTETNPTHCMDSESKDFDTGMESWKPWADCGGTSILSAGAGQKTIYRQIRDVGYNVSSTKSDSIILNIPPTPWNIQTIPAGTAVLYSVYGASENFVLAVGEDGSDPKKGIIMKYNGSDWSMQTINDSRTLQGVSVVSDKNAWAVGNDGGEPITGLIYSYNGTAWSKDTIPAGGQDFKAVDALDKTHIWAVGAGVNATTDKVYFNNGTSWSKQTVPGGVHVLAAVSAADATNVWAGGGDGSDSGVIIYFNGTSWSKQTIPAGITNINAIHALNKTNVWAGGKNSQGKGVVLYYNGTSWRQQTIPSQVTQIHGVQALNDLVVRAVGQKGSYATLIEFNEGKGWSEVPQPLGNRSLSSIYNLDPENAWAVGDGVGAGAAMKFTPLNNKPVLAFVEGLKQAKDGSGNLEIPTTIFDPDENQVALKVYYSIDQGQNFCKAAIVNVLVPELPNNQKPKVHDPEDKERQIDEIRCKPEPMRLIFIWDPKSELNECGSLDDVEMSDVRVKVSPFDGTDFGDDMIQKDIFLDIKKPDFTKIKPSNEKHNSAIITWTTDEAATSQVRYTEDGSINSVASIDAVDWDYTTEDTTLVTSHSVKVTGLKPFTAYNFQTISADVYGNEEISATDEFVTTDQPDTTKPVISGVTTTTTTTTATVTWETDEAATSQVEYGKTTNYGNTTTLDATLVASHEVIISGLDPGTQYHFRVKTKDDSNNEKVSKDYTFTTVSGTDEDAPVISGVAAVTSRTAATVVWTTDEPATSEVIYGTTTNYGSTSEVDTDLDASHSVNLSDLSADTIYHFKVKSKDDTGNEAESDDAVFTTDEMIVVPPPTDVVFNGGTLPSDTGQVAVNTDYRPVFSGNLGAEYAGYTVTIYIYSDPKVYSTTAASDGSWSITPTEDLTEGEHEVYLQLTDTEGVSTARVKIATIAIVPEGSFVIWPREGTIATVRKPIIKGLAISGATVKVYIDDIYNGQTTASIHSSGTGSFAYTPFVDLALGAHTAKIIVENSAGTRLDASGDITFHVERPYISPVLTKITDLDTLRPKIWGLAKNGSTVQVFIDYQLYGEFTVTDHASGTASFVYEPFLSLKPGVHTVYLVAKDSRGKSSPIAGKQHIVVQDQVVKLSEPKQLSIWDKVVHIVQGSDCLWKLAQEYYGDGSLYHRIIELNKDKYPSITNTIIVDGWELIIQ